MEQGQAPIFIVLNAAPEEIAFKLPEMPDYKNWQQVLNTTEDRARPPPTCVGRRDQGAAALGACLCGRGMNAPAIRPQADEGRRAVSAVGAGGKTRRCDAGTTHAMKRGDDGWFTADIAGVTAGTRYKFRIDDEIDVPDPASAFQPDDVFGPSEVIDHAAYPWRAADWRGRPVA